MGGIRSENCNDLAKEIWFWCIKNNIWLSAVHIAGNRNLADSPLRQFNVNGPLPSLCFMTCGRNLANQI